MTEPERIPISDPGENYMSSRKVGEWQITTHQAVDGSWYEIRNRSTAEANNSLHFERIRNEGLRLKALLKEEDQDLAERGSDPE